MRNQIVFTPSLRLQAAIRTGASGRVHRARAVSLIPPPNIWSIVLAGGEGERLRVLTKRWLGTHRPKQYCAFVGQRSMLQHTLDRAMLLSGTERSLVVVASQHAPDVWKHLRKINWEQTILQPRNCGTAPGIFLPLAHIMAKDPDATVVILPSDHFVFPEEVFSNALRRVVIAACRFPDKLVLLGAHADGPETEYGWIQPGKTIDWVNGHAVRAVTGFREKPNLREAQRLLAAGALWNTMVMAAPVKTLWELGQCLPDMMRAFENLRHHLGTGRAQQVLNSIYESMPSINFSSHLVEKVPAAAVVVELRDVVWSDWGNEERIVATLRAIGRTPWFKIARRLRSPKGIRRGQAAPGKFVRGEIV